MESLINYISLLWNRLITINHDRHSKYSLVIYHWMYLTLYFQTLFITYHYEFDAAGTLAENDNPMHCEDAIHCNARRLPQDSLLALIH